jgi:hypothetical protein
MSTPERTLRRGRVIVVDPDANDGAGRETLECPYCLYNGVDEPKRDLEPFRVVWSEEHWCPIDFGPDGITICYGAQERIIDSCGPNRFQCGDCLRDFDLSDGEAGGVMLTPEHTCRPNPVECPTCHGDGRGQDPITEEQFTERASAVYDSDAVCEGCGADPRGTDGDGRAAISDPRWFIETKPTGADSFVAVIRCPNCCGPAQPPYDREPFLIPTPGTDPQDAEAAEECREPQQHDEGICRTVTGRKHERNPDI